MFRKEENVIDLLTVCVQRISKLKTALTNVEMVIDASSKWIGTKDKSRIDQGDDDLNDGCANVLAIDYDNAHWIQEYPREYLLKTDH